MLSLGEVFERYKNLPEFDEIILGDVNQKGNFGNSPLHVACVRGDLEEVVALLEAGANPNLKGEHGCTPLHDAVQQEHPEVVKLLLEKGASPTIKSDFFNRTPYEYVVAHHLQ